MRGANPLQLRGDLRQPSASLRNFGQNGLEVARRLAAISRHGRASLAPRGLPLPCPSRPARLRRPGEGGGQSSGYRAS